MRKPSVIVVGGGIIGRSVAWRLAEKSVGTITLLAGRRPKASAAAAGMLAPSFEALHPRATEASAMVGHAALGLWDGFAQDLATASDMDIDYHRNGIIGLDLSAERIPGAREIDPVGALNASVFTLVEGEGQADPRRLLQALSVAGDRHAITVLEANAVAVEMANGRVTELITDERDRLAADLVIFATGFVTSPISELTPPLMAVPGRAFSVAGIKDISGGRVMRAADVYFCPKSDGYLYVGATEEPTVADDLITGGANSLDDLWQRAIGYWPDLAKGDVVGRFEGVRPASPTGRPIVERSADTDNLIYALGHDRNGVLLAPWTAQEVLRFVEAFLA